MFHYWKSFLHISGLFLPWWILLFLATNSTQTFAWRLLDHLTLGTCAKSFQVQTLLPVRIFHVYKEEQWNVRQCKEPSSPEETILQTLGDGHIYAIFFNIKLLVQFHSIGQFFCNLKELTISIKVFFPSNVKKGNLSGPTLILIFFLILRLIFN